MSEEILCPKCGSNQVTANKKGFSGKKAVAGAVLTGGIGLLAGTIGSNKVKITCLSCGHEFKPGQQAKSQADFQQKKKLEKQTGIGCAVIIVIAVIIGLIGKSCGTSSNKTESDYKQKAESYSFAFEIDKTALVGNPFEYLDTKTLEIVAAYKLLEENSSSLEQKTKFINELKQFDQKIISNLNNEITAIGYLDFSIPKSKNPNKSMNIYLTNNNLKDIHKVLIYQEKFNDQFKGISSNSPLYKKAKQLQYSKVKFTAKLIYFDGIESQVEEFKKGNMTVDDELKLSLYSNYVQSRAYRAEFISFEKVE